MRGGAVRDDGPASIREGPKRVGPVQAGCWGEYGLSTYYVVITSVSMKNPYLSQITEKTNNHSCQGILDGCEPEVRLRRLGGNVPES